MLKRLDRRGDVNWWLIVPLIIGAILLIWWLVSSGRLDALLNQVFGVSPGVVTGG